MTRVRIPPVLRVHVGDQKEVDASGTTVGGVLNDLVGRYPELGEQLYNSDGALHRFVNVYVNGRDVRYLEVLDTPVGERDAVIILPAMAGGCAPASTTRGA